MIISVIVLWPCVSLSNITLQSLCTPFIDNLYGLLFSETHLPLLFTLLERCPDSDTRANIIIALGDMYEWNVCDKYGCVLIGVLLFVDQGFPLSQSYRPLDSPYVRPTSSGRESKSSKEYSDGVDSSYFERHDKSKCWDSETIDMLLRCGCIQYITCDFMSWTGQVKGEICEMAICVEDPDPRMADLARLFFHELSKKGTFGLLSIWTRMISNNAFVFFRKESDL